MVASNDIEAVVIEARGKALVKVIIETCLLTDEEKVNFMKSVMPSFCEIFSKNPEKMMTEMLPLCRELMMKTCNMDMQGMMKMMGMKGI